MYDYRDFSIISSDSDLELLCDSRKYDNFKQAVNLAVGYLIDMAEVFEQYNPNDLALFVSKRDDIVSLRKIRSGQVQVDYSEPLSVWLDLLEKDRQLFEC